MLLDQAGIRKLEALFGVFISTMVVMFGWQYFSSLPPQGEVFRGWWEPRIMATHEDAHPRNVHVAGSDDNFQQAAGMIGAGIMPHNIFLHSALVLSRKVPREWKLEPQKTHHRSAVALLVSFVINLFVVSVFAKLSYFADDGTPQSE
eukprot:gene5510-7943_t